MTIPRGYFLIQQWFCHNPLLNIEQISWYLTDFLNFLNKYTWVPWQMRKKQGYQICPAPSPRSYDMAPGPHPLASVPDPHTLLVIMTFLENQSMLLVLLVHCFCEYSCFEINSMAEKFNSVSPKLLSPLSFCDN